jgi:CheY-like chemotaxis protein/HPt (histidine-containing phosphotransfer) domain-containing protein
MQSRIFDVFYQVANQSNHTYKGTGLGLAICSQLVKMMNGTFGVDSTVGKGSSFWFTIPFKKVKKTTQLNNINSSNIEDIRFTGMILLVEDNPVNQKVATTMLRHVGFEVKIAENGLDGFEAVQNSVFDLVLMDCQMPVMDGYDAVKNIREWEGSDLKHSQTKRIPVIAMTAHALSGEKEKCLRFGMDDYLAKPLTQFDLVKTILRWLPHKVKRVDSTNPKNTLQRKPHETKSANEKPLYSKQLKSIDISYLNAIKTINPNQSLSVLQTSVDTYFDHSAKLLNEMKQSVLDHDFVTLSKSAHSLNSSSSQMGAIILSKKCQLLEQNANSNTFDTCNSLVQLIEDEFETVKMELRILVSNEVNKDIE